VSPYFDIQNMEKIFGVYLGQMHNSGGKCADDCANNSLPNNFRHCLQLAVV
jgi:hypothetical protein